MMPRRPPRLADRLLHRLASGPRRLSLIGDLHEQYGRGRSASWYWRQTIKTIFVGIASDLRRHPFESLHALCAGWGAVLLYNTVILSPIWWLFQRIALNSETMRRSVVFPGTRILLGFIGACVVGRVLVRFHSERRAVSLLLLVVAVIFTGLPRLFSLSVDAWGYSNYRLYLGMQIVSVLVPALGIIVGGLSDERPADHNLLTDGGSSPDQFVQQ